MTTKEQMPDTCPKCGDNNTRRHKHVVANNGIVWICLCYGCDIEFYVVESEVSE